MPSRKVLAFVAAVCGAAAVAVANADWAGLLALPAEDFGGFAALVGVAILSEGMAIRIGGAKGTTHASITFIPMLASAQLFGPASAIALLAVSVAVAEFLIRKKELIKGIFNVAQWSLAAAVAGWAFTMVGGVPLEGPDTGGTPVEIATQFWPFLTFGVVFLLLNHYAVSVAIALSQDLHLRDVWPDLLRRSGGSLNDMLTSPMAIAVAFLYIQLGLPGILVILFPLLFIRHSYFQNNQLRNANKDLLQALVKAIETRDPYTSGHSLRVSRLARKVAERLRLSRGTVERIETAALLHDIGKIEAVYTDILRKPDSLTPEERRVIESHVVKGEELLRSLQSLPEEVVLTVRHHHERYDGRGYPDRIAGEAIPIGARIIVACDAVDAMLSDRPYRKALALADVERELEAEAGRQFDPDVVAALLRNGILPEFAARMGTARAEARDEEAPSDLVRPTPPSRRSPQRTAPATRL